MNIYKAEASIADKIKNNKIICSSKIEPSNFEFAKSYIENVTDKPFNLDKFAFANINDSDLYFHQSILVTTNWNANDDLFLPEHVWAARQTPNHKPTNFNHNSTQIAGHIVGSYGLSYDGNLIADDTLVEDLPTSFHILTSAVIYKLWHSDAEYQERAEQLISDIESGEMYVSMECVFPDFSYALSDNNGNIKIISRNENTAFLSSHLRYYGGAGTYNEYRIARVPKNLRFIGKGYTKNPANKESIVFNKDNLFSFNSLSFIEKLEDNLKSGVILSSTQNLIGDSFMSENIKFDELVSLNKTLQEQLDKAKADLAKADIEKFEDKISAIAGEKEVLEAQLKSSNEDVESLQKTIAEQTAALAAKDEEIQKISDEKESLAKEIDELNKSTARAERIAKFVELGYDAEAAEKKADIFANLNDDQFNTVIAEMKPVQKKDEKKDEKKEKELSKNNELDKAGELNASAVDVEALEETEEKTSVASDDTESETEENTLSVASFIAKKLNVENK